MQIDRPLHISKKIVRIELLHLDEPGYGPTGLLTRTEWRSKCLSMLNSSANEWSTWNNIEIKPSLSPYKQASFAYLIYFEGENNPHKIEPHQSNLPSVTLDFIGLDFLKPKYIHRSFEGHALFDASTFHGGVSLINSVEFKRFVSFQYVTFSKLANFNLVKFNRQVNFQNSIFEADALFNGVNFFGDAFFNNVCFNFKAQYGGVTFAGNAIFKDCNFVLEAGFGGAKFKANTYFNGSNFLSLTWFEGTSFDRVGHFENTYFNESPTFISVSLETPLLFRNAFFQRNYSPESAERYAALKQLSESSGQTEQSLRFNALELQARRHDSNYNFSFRFITYLYELSSDYGRSFSRPLIAYLGLLICTWFFALNSGMYMQGSTYLSPAEVLPLKDKCKERDNCAFELSAYRAATEYTLYRAVGVLDFSDNDKKTADVNERLFGQPFEPAWMRLWGIIKAILSTALLFLTALGLRNRYRLK